MKWLSNLYRTYIFDPLAGGNGKIQTSEYVQWILVIMIVRASVKEGDTGEQVYPDIYWIMIFTAVTAIAGFKQIFKFKHNNNDNQNTYTDNSIAG